MPTTHNLIMSFNISFIKLNKEILAIMFYDKSELLQVSLFAP